MSTYFLFAILLLGFVITFQIAKASEYVGILKGEKKNNEQNNRNKWLSDDCFSCTWSYWRLLVQ